MSRTYITILGDTFELIARKQYGSELEADRIAKANPGVTEPLTSGAVIYIPVLPLDPSNTLPNSLTENVNEVSLLIDNKRFRFWTDIRITRSIDNMDIVEFSSPFESAIQLFRDTFRPFSFKSIVVNVGSEVLFTGVMVGVNPVLETNSKIISISCYSLPGVLNDCTSPASSYPLEFNNLSLRGIAISLAEPFGLGVMFDVDPGAVFDRVAPSEEETILSFLAGLAKQRNLIISSTPNGELLFQQSVDVGSPVAILHQGESPVLSVTPLFTPQQYYSHITGIEPAITGSQGSQFTVKNPRLLGVLRPNTFKVPDTSNADVKKAVEARTGRMFGNMVSYSITMPTWRDSTGELWSPNNTVKLLAPDAMIYNEYEFVIRNVDYKRNNESESAILNLVIPGSFEGKIPDTLPWDE